MKDRIEPWMQFRVPLRTQERELREFDPSTSSVLHARISLGHICLRMTARSPNRILRTENVWVHPHTTIQLSWRRLHQHHSPRRQYVFSIIANDSFPTRRIGK